MYRPGHHLGKGLLAGLVGGVVGTIAMTQFQNAWKKAVQPSKSAKPNRRNSAIGKGKRLQTKTPP